MSLPAKIEAFLEAKHAPFTHIVHAPAFTARQLARVEHIPEHQTAKTVVFVGDDVYAMAVLPADERIDVERLRKGLGLDHLRLASEDEIAELFPDCETGAMPPFGPLFGLPVYVDEELAAQPTIEIPGGTHYDALRMKYRDFEAVAEPTVVGFGRFD